jgi:hypothetical protein
VDLVDLVPWPEEVVLVVFLVDLVVFLVEVDSVVLPAVLVVLAVEAALDSVDLVVSAAWPVALVPVVSVALVVLLPDLVVLEVSEHQAVAPQMPQAQLEHQARLAQMPPAAVLHLQVASTLSKHCEIQSLMAV